MRKLYSLCMLDNTGKQTNINFVFLQNKYVDYIDLSFLNLNMNCTSTYQFFMKQDFIIIKYNGDLLYSFTNKYLIKLKTRTKYLYNLK